MLLSQVQCITVPAPNTVVKVLYDLRTCMAFFVEILCVIVVLFTSVNVKAGNNDRINKRIKKVYKNGDRRRSCTSNTAKIHHFVSFVKYATVSSLHCQ